MTKKQINPNLKKLAEMTCNPGLKMPNLEEGVEEVMQDLQFPVKNLQDYIRVAGTGYVIAKAQTDNGLQYEPTHIQVLQRGLEIPIPALFTTHLLNVINAKKGKLQLYDGLGQVLGNSEVEQIYNGLTSDCWVWLNAGFKKVREGEGYQAFDLERVTGLDSNGGLVKHTAPLEQCLMEDCFVNLNGSQFNNQGLATKKSSARGYQQGKVIKFWHPRNNRVARFDAISGGVDLLCDRDPDYSGGSLGVFGVCEANATQ